MEKVKFAFHQSPSNLPWRSYLPHQEGWDETNYFQGKDWSDLKISDFNSHPYCLSFIDVRAFPFFWGAIMFLSLEQRVWNCRAMENFLIMWESFELPDQLPDNDADIGITEKVSRELRSVLGEYQIDVIESYFRVRSSAGTVYDEVASSSFVASLRISH
jgi:hypothetical protein